MDFYSFMVGLVQDQIDVFLSILQSDCLVLPSWNQLNVAKARQGKVKSVVFDLAPVGQG